MSWFSIYSNLPAGFGGGGSSNQQNLSNIYNSLTSIQNSIGTVNGSSVIDSSDTLLKNQQDLEDLLNNRLQLLTDAITTSSITDISSNIAMINAISNSSDNQNTKLELLASAITNSSINDISSNASLVMAISNSVNNQGLNNNSLITTLVEKITDSRDNIMNKLISLDNSFNKINNETMQVISNNDANFNQVLLNNQTIIDNNKTLILSKMLDIDLSFNVSLNNKTTEILIKLIEAETKFNTVLLATDESFGVALSNNTTNMIDKMVDLDISLNSIIGDNTYMVINKLIESQTEFNNKLLETDISFNNQLNQSTQLIFDKINKSDISFNHNLTNIITRMVETDLSYNTVLSNNTTTMLSKLVNYDISVNSAITESTSNLLTKIVETDLSFNLALGAFSLDLFKTVDINFTDISLNVDLGGGIIDIIDKIVTYDASLNQRIIDNQLVFSNKQTDLISHLDMGYNSIYDKISDVLIANSTISDSLNDNFTDLMQSLNIKSNDTQQALMQYIGKYIVIPLYEQRLNDIVILYYERFNNEFLNPIKTLLDYFRKGNFADLAINYNHITQEIMAMKLLNFKNQAFEKLLSTSSNAKGCNDMTPDAIKYYKQIRNYVAWGYKSLDGLSKAIKLNDKLLILEAENALGKIDQDILNDPEKLALYLELQKKTSGGTLFTVERSVNINKLIKLKPRYQEYVCRHGWPEDGIFEARKMAIITNDLIAAGTILYPAINSDTSCNTTTDTSCNTATDTSCNTATDTSCNTTTDTSCNTATDTSCNTTCDTSCNTTCDTSCNTTCDTSCNTTCDTSCNTTCDTSCNTTCDTCRILLCKTYIDSNSTKDDCSDWCLSDFENNINNTVVKYMVYITDFYDLLHPHGTYYYPLFTDKMEAIKAIDINYYGYNSSMDVYGNTYTSNDSCYPNNVTRFIFRQIPNKEFWMPNSHPYRSIGLHHHPPLGLEYMFYTPYIGLGGIEYNPYKTCDSHSFELNILSLKKSLSDTHVYGGYHMPPAPVPDITVNITWGGDIDASFNNWRTLFKFKTNATVIDDLYNENITFITDPSQWHDANLLNNKIFPDTTTISENFYQHIYNLLHHTPHYIPNKDEFVDKYNDISLNSDIRELLIKSHIQGQDNYTSIVDLSANPTNANIIPFTILTQLFHNYTLGYNRIALLLDSRDNINEEVSLLQIGDKLILNITLMSNIEDLSEQLSYFVSDDFATKSEKTYKIILTLI